MAYQAAYALTIADAHAILDDAEGYATNREEHDAIKQLADKLAKSIPKPTRSTTTM